MPHTEESLKKARKIWIGYLVVAAAGDDPIAQGLAVDLEFGTRTEGRLFLRLTQGAFHPQASRATPAMWLQ